MEITEKMDKNNTNTGYLLGRLMAVVEKAQQEALKKNKKDIKTSINATVIDRYFSAATASPASVFPRLMKKRMNHIRKLKSEDKQGLVTWLEKMTDDIMANLDNFPLFMPIEDQSLFILGYHHQRHELWRKKSEDENEEE